MIRVMHSPRLNNTHERGRSKVVEQKVKRGTRR